jgi:CMP-N,N'-diacetyllegionaminic acid synthase
MILQPTSPLRDEEDIKNAVKIFSKKQANSVVSMCECEHSPLLTKELDENLKLDDFLADLKNTRRQDLKKIYRLNGAIYLSKIDYFLKYKNFYKENSYAYIMGKKKSIDIDDIYDFKFSESIMRDKDNIE